MRRRLACGLALLVLLSASAQAWSQSEEPPPPKVSLGAVVEPTERYARQRGLTVRSVDPDSPAGKAGLKPDDLIVRLGDKRVRDYDTIMDALAGREPGDRLDVLITRDGKDQIVSLTLGKRQPGGAEGRAVGSATTVRAETQSDSTEQKVRPASFVTGETSDPASQDKRSNQELVRRIEQLERRVRELEQQRARLEK